LLLSLFINNKFLFISILLCFVHKYIVFFELICKEGCRFSMGWCIREPYCPLSSAVCNTTIPTLLLSQHYYYPNITIIPTLLLSQHYYYPNINYYYPNITIIWDGRICMFAVLLRFTLSFLYKVYIGFLSPMRDWTVTVAQYSKFAC
jgi:hypothetical protein